MAQFYYKNGSSWINALNLFYPQGAIYASTTSTSPGTLFGGTWQQISNAALRAATASIATYTGSDTHTLTVNEIPAHKHNLAVPVNGGGYYGWHLTSTNANEYGLSDTTCAKAGGGQHILSCNAPTTAICGGEQPRIEVAA